ncbi:MAG: hypothetical protein WA080_03750 [Sulfuricurvum sp.]
MQTFSDMQRSISYQNTLSDFLWIIAFCLYSPLTSIYLFLPPMLAVMGYLFYRAFLRNDLYGVVIFSIMLLMIEAEKGYWFGSSIVFFTLVSRYVMPYLEQTFRCKLCIKGIFVLLSYLLFWVVLMLFNGVFLVESPILDWHAFLYMTIEFFVMIVL